MLEGAACVRSGRSEIGDLVLGVGCFVTSREGHVHNVVRPGLPGSVDVAAVERQGRRLRSRREIEIGARGGDGGAARVGEPRGEHVAARDADIDRRLHEQRVGRALAKPVPTLDSAGVPS